MKNSIKPIFTVKEASQDEKLLGFEAKLKAHPAWRGNNSLSENIRELSESDPLSFVFSPGSDRYHYVLSYVAPDLQIKHKNMRIVLCKSEAKLLNGGASGPFDSVDHLFFVCLKAFAIYFGGIQAEELENVFNQNVA
ncbi:hypothetical protein [Candidatus Neptunochlamydia vexilliferae]|uniref:Uncharacterized protein n=1 Tax=Candidatus Neptunichlamydia vexilliferae TaxID=1651774 RepID=A0ABS0B0D8_9BACT|nr:hypothetical protein [Candidatus Neptunochlamydia vexilliferae]MBF5059664.1 hypothetical protein [Candidatus Neptunochlamydia vexilliferae]